MTNWCYNRMKITGTISEISRFKQTCIVHENEQARLDFNAIDPMPDFSDTDALPYNDPGTRWGMTGAKSIGAPNRTLAFST